MYTRAYLTCLDRVMGKTLKMKPHGWIAIVAATSVAGVFVGNKVIGDDHSTEAKEKPKTGAETISVDYQDKAKNEAALAAAIAEAKKTNAAYAERISTFDPKKYSLPTTKLSSEKIDAACTNGFGGDMVQIGSGMLNEPLYALDAEKIQTEIEGEFGYAPYINAYFVVGDILFKKPIDVFDRKLLTFEQLTRNFSDSRIVAGNTSYKNSYSTMESKFGFPQAYLKQQAGLVVSLTAFNDVCVKGIAQKNLYFDRVDLSGKPISQVLGAKYDTEMFHGVNGLYNHTSKSPDFVSPSFLEWIQSNNRAYQNITGNSTTAPYAAKYATAVFPKGAYLYAPVRQQTTQETVNVNFKSKPIATGISLEKAKAAMLKELDLKAEDITWVKEKFEDYSIYKAAKKDDFEPASNIVLVQKGANFYGGRWEVKSDAYISSNSAERSNLVMMNQAAVAAVIELTKDVYQGGLIEGGGAKREKPNKWSNPSQVAAEDAAIEREIAVDGKLDNSQ